jgi:hypothetical protein
VIEIRLQSSRLVGLELEYDCGSSARRDLASVRGWSSKYDGSLSNGYEYVLEPCLPLQEAKERVAEFCQVADLAKLNLHKSGGFHVHVQSKEFGYPNNTRPQSIYNGARLVRLYHHFQEGIDRLVAKSRHQNRYCAKYQDHTVADHSVVATFELGNPAENRAYAKLSRNPMVVNLAMCRVTSPAQRSIEFRQGSSSTNFCSVWGWTCFSVFLVEAVVRELDLGFERYSRSLEGLVEWAKTVDAVLGSNLADWIVWRNHYLNRPPTEQEVHGLVNVVTRTPRGIFHIARKLNVNFSVAMKAADEAARLGLITEVTVGGKKRWKRAHTSMVSQDIAELESMIGLPT